MISIENYLRINVVDMIMVLTSTLLIVFIAKKFFWNVLEDYLAKREQFIQSQIDEAVTRNSESEKMKEEASQALANVHAQAESILESAKEAASKESKEIIARANSEASLLKEKALREIEQEKNEAMASMKEEISDIALLAAKKLVEKEVDDDLHRKYVKDFINEVGEQPWQA
ncbi:MAG: F0F1 ATP synthase subunit B [Erysipelotrichaceae bacterium]|nr:F0F1 ATP synthase subunit B [Erysipelotrichaceae bacterium]